jgi:hypothetical protein
VRRVVAKLRSYEGLEVDEDRAARPVGDALQLDEVKDIITSDRLTWPAA